MGQDSGLTQQLAARLSAVVFSYDRDTELQSPDAYTESHDPDARGGAVLRGIDLDLLEGSFTVIMGASGGGKSTLVRTLNGIIPNFITGTFDGDVSVLGTDPTTTRVPEMAADVGMVLQDYESQLFGTSVETEVAFGPENLAVPVDRIGPRIEHALSIVGLSELNWHRSPDALSGGQKQRLVFASVLANHPELLVLDEPTSDLDPLGSRETLSVVRRLATTDSQTRDQTPPEGWNGPDTIVAVTHKIEEALLADRAVLLKDGTIYRHGPAREVFTDTEALRDARVAVPPMVETFDRLGWPAVTLPLTPSEAVNRLSPATLTWDPPATTDTTLPGVPADTGQDPGPTVFELEGITYAYETDRGPVVAVDDVDLTVREGEVLAIVGHNGSGKTTLAKHLNGLLTPDEGTARWRSDDLASVPMATVGQSVGYVFQNPDHQIFADTVREEVAFGPKNFGIEGDELETAVDDALATVELDGLATADPFDLSKGQRQRVALASVLATDPETIIFDEPTTGLDATQERAFMQLVARLNREEGLTVVMVTHSMETVTRYAPRTVVMADGQKVADRPTRELFADEAALRSWELTPPHPVALSNRLAEQTDQPDALPALSVDELVAGLGGVDGDSPPAPDPDTIDGAEPASINRGESQ